MSASRGDEGNVGVRQEEDRVPLRAVVLLTAATAAIVAGGIAWAGLWVLGEARGVALPEHARSPERVGRVLQTLVWPDDPADRRTPPDAERLERFGWVDREQGLVHIPVRDALELVLEEEASP